MLQLVNQYVLTIYYVLERNEVKRVPVLRDLEYS